MLYLRDILTRTSCFLSARKPRVWTAQGHMASRQHFHQGPSVWLTPCVLRFHQRSFPRAGVSCLFPSPERNSGQSETTCTPESVHGAHGSKRRAEIQSVSWSGWHACRSWAFHWACSPNKGWFLLNFIWEKLHQMMALRTALSLRSLLSPAVTLPKLHWNQSTRRKHRWAPYSY